MKISYKGTQLVVPALTVNSMYVLNRTQAERVGLENVVELHDDVFGLKKSDTEQVSKFVSVYEHTEFLSGRPNRWPKYKGSFFSRESAEATLGWFYLSTCCEVV